MNRHVIVAGQLQDKKKKDVNFTNFPGYRAKELAELPGQLEAPQLLHRVTQAQDFDVRGLKTYNLMIFLLMFKQNLQSFAGNLLEYRGNKGFKINVAIFTLVYKFEIEKLYLVLLSEHQARKRPERE